MDDVLTVAVGPEAVTTAAGGSVDDAVESVGDAVAAVVGTEAVTTRVGGSVDSGVGVTVLPAVGEGGVPRAFFSLAKRQSVKYRERERLRLRPLSTEREAQASR